MNENWGMRMNRIDGFIFAGNIDDEIEEEWTQKAIGTKWNWPTQIAGDPMGSG
jgi:hypothetical protein